MVKCQVRCGVSGDDVMKVGMQCQQGKVELNKSGGTVRATRVNQAKIRVMM